MKILILFFFLVKMPAVFGAACCGGGSVLPSLITGDNRAQVSLAASLSEVIGDVWASQTPVFRNRDLNLEGMQNLRLDAALQFKERWQSSVSIPVTRKLRRSGDHSATSTNLGDVSVLSGYEVLPELEYSVWKPKGYIFVSTVFPTGRSSYESKSNLSVDQSGRGFFTPGIGSLWIKQWGAWDVLASTEIHRSLPRKFQTEKGTVYLKPSFGGMLLAGAGYSPPKTPLRFGVALSPQYEGTQKVYGISDYKMPSQLVWNTTASLSALLQNEWSLTASYHDQTLVGPVRNVILTRSVSLLAQRFWGL